MAIAESVTVTICKFLDPAPAAGGSLDWKEDLGFIRFQPDVCIVRSFLTFGSLGTNYNNAIGVIVTDMIQERQGILVSGSRSQSVNSPIYHYQPIMRGQTNFSYYAYEPGHRPAGVAYPDLHMTLTLEFIRYA